MAWETLASAGIGILPDLIGLFTPEDGPVPQFAPPPSVMEAGLPPNPYYDAVPGGAGAGLTGGLADLALAAIRGAWSSGGASGSSLGTGSGLSLRDPSMRLSLSPGLRSHAAGQLLGGLRYQPKQF